MNSRVYTEKQREQGGRLRSQHRGVCACLRARVHLCVCVCVFICFPALSAERDWKQCYSTEFTWQPHWPLGDLHRSMCGTHPEALEILTVTATLFLFNLPNTRRPPAHWKDCLGNGLKCRFPGATCRDVRWARECVFESPLVFSVPRRREICLTREVSWWRKQHRPPTLQPRCSPPTKEASLPTSSCPPTSSELGLGPARLHLPLLRISSSGSGDNDEISESSR